MTNQKKHSLEPVRVEDFCVRSYEIDSRGQVSIQSLCRYLGEIAGNHAEKLGASVGILRSKNLTWVLSRLHVRMKKYPYWGKSLTIETWPSGRENLYALRDFLIFSQEELIGTATTSWMVIDLARKKPVLLPEFVTAIPIPERPRAIDDPFEKLPGLKTIHSSRSFNVRLSDLDINQHVNFVNYIEWGVETVPTETWKDFRLEELEISYRAESRFGDRIISEAQEIDQQKRRIYLHRLQKEQDHRETAVLRTAWTRW
ncbi:MAG: hypothetical protein JXB26_06140 [Candidatus Aminicenantes bacterium]|nr:hypothetical protein [Candidatus Aminicenantes bacterium]